MAVGNLPALHGGNKYDDNTSLANRCSHCAGYIHYATMLVCYVLSYKYVRL